MNQATAPHEGTQASDEIKVGSERSFGIVFAVFFTLVAALPLLQGGSVRLWSAGLAVLFVFVAFVVPGVLRPLNLIWFKFGLLLHAIMNPLIMGLLFFFTVTPIALIMRVLGKDPLRLKADPSAESYWIDRTPPGPEPETMKYQF